MIKQIKSVIQKKKTKKLSRWLAAAMAVVMIGVQTVDMMATVRTVKASEEVGAVHTFVHPGMLHTEDSFTKIKENIDNQVQPNLDTWNALYWDGFSSASWNPRPLQTVSRGVNNNYAQFYIDIRRAYQTALIWKISGSKEHGEAACRILNAWSDNMEVLTGNADRFLAAGIYGYELANAAEIMRDHPDFHKEEMEKLLLNIFYPMNADFLTRHNDAHIGNYWANWDLCNIASMMAIGIFCDREDIYYQALMYAKNGLGNGSIYNAIPYVYEDGTAQWQEAGRDQGHSTFGVGLCSVICEMAWNQGNDLYGLSDNRFLKGAEYVARYNNGEDVSYSAYEWNQGQSGNSVWQTVVSEAGRGSNRPIYSLVYNHYVNRMGLSAPNIEKVLKDEQGNWKIEGACTNGDELGWQTLTFANLSEPVEKEDIQGEFADGTYRIRAFLTGKSLVADEQGVLSFAKSGSSDGEWWNLKNVGDGEYVITNCVTGQAMQLNGTDYYTYGIGVGTGTQKENDLTQHFAILKNDTGDYRIVGSLNGFALDIRDSNTSDDAQLIQWRYHSADCQKWVLEEKEELEKKAEQKEKLATFSFDDKTDGFSGENAKAQIVGNVELSKESKVESAIYLDGSGQGYLKVTDKEGNALLRGYDELTISYWSKTANLQNANWSFYAAPKDTMQTYLWETYLGVIEQNATLNAQRYQNTGERPTDVSAGLKTENGMGQWNYVTIVYAKDKTICYINGEKKQEMESAYDVSDIVGINGVCYIGKANWGSGEYYNGWLDEFSIYSYALEEKETKEAYEEALAQSVAYEEKCKQQNQSNPSGNGSSTTKISISDCTVSNIPVQYYNGKAKKPAVSVTYKGKKLVQGKDYTLTYSNNKKIGTAKVVIAGKGTYTSKITKTFQIKVKKNAKYKSGVYQYKITKAAINGKGTVSLIGVTNKNRKKYKIPSTVKIGGRSFKVTAIENKAFQKCKKAKTITVGKNVKTIGNKAFYKCSSLEKITIPKKVKKIGKQAFVGCKKLKVKKVQ